MLKFCRKNNIKLPCLRENNMHNRLLLFHLSSKMNNKLNPFHWCLNLNEKSRKYQGVFEVKSRVKTWQVRGIWSQQLEHQQVPKWGRNQVSGRVSVPCWHATPVANAPWKPLIIGEGQARYQGHEIGGKSDWLGSHCWSRIRMSFNIRERDTSYC